MQTLTINITNDSLVEKVMWLLEHFKNDGLEIVSKILKLQETLTKDPLNSSIYKS